MKHYNQFVTYYEKRKITDEQRQNYIKDQEEFLLSGGKKGYKNLNLFLNADRITRLTTQFSPSALRTPYFDNLFRMMAEPMKRMTRRINEFLEENNINEMYEEFKIPKATGGFRTINAPKRELKHLQRIIADELVDMYHFIPHNAAHAYTQGRSIATNAQTHVDSNHFLKIDFSNFFPSFTKEVLMKQLSQVGFFTYSYVRLEAKEFLEAIINISLLNGSLPQGSPLSPLLTNLAMIPFDYYLYEYAEKQKSLVVTRYADDLEFSSYYAFADRKEEAKEKMEAVVQEISDNFYDGVLKINSKKTRVSTKFGKNRITGVKVNKDNKLSIGYKEKKEIKQQLARLIIKKKYEKEELSNQDVIIGHYNYLHQIEPEYAKYVLRTLERKFDLNTDVLTYLTKP